MSFTAAGALTQAASDNFAVGNDRPGASTTDIFFVGGATYLVTIPTAGVTTFTTAFKRGNGGTATFNFNEITVQLFSTP